ncbi:MAG: DUF222 domain-containing protein [Acidimicrobiia bacterium]|nr:DUF222 domain-containing protein [Acidimicrobiia bacterium]
MKTRAFDNLTTDELEQQLAELESFVAQARARQVGLLREADHRQVPSADGCRSLGEWTAGRLDIAPETAKDLVTATRMLADQPELEESLAAGRSSFDRILATARLGTAGASPRSVGLSAGLDIPGVRRLTAQQRRIPRHEGHRIFSDRFLMLQPTLDRRAVRLWGQLPGMDGDLVELALHGRGDQFPLLPDGTRGSLGQRNADALVSIAQDSLTASSGDTTSNGPILSVFTNGNLAASSHGQAGSVTSSGIQVGVSTIEEILCAGSVEHTVITDGQPHDQGRTTRVIPPRLKRFILYRDGGCCADGCTSRYRLQPHHRLPWSQGGQTNASNLTTLCWFHHHVVIHQMGFEIDPESPPGRLRFTPSRRDPP